MMNRFIFAFLLLIFGFGSAQDVLTDPAPNQSEHILSWHSDISIDKDAKVTITEKIKIYAGGNIFKRGIYRALPISREINNKKIKVKYDILSVKRDGVDENYHTEKTGSDLAIYVGNKDHILEHGIYVYDITYSTSGHIGFFENYDEFYWNVNGTLWDFPVNEISAIVTLPQAAKIVQQYCYTGAYGGTESNCIGKELSSHSLQWSAKNLNQNEGLTVAVGFSKGVFAPPPPPSFLARYGIFGLLLFAAIFLSVYFYNQWNKYGVDPQKPVVYPQFNAPDNLSPASIGYLEKEIYSGQMVTAALVSLATKGFVKIIEDDKRVLGIFGSKVYTLEQIKEQDQTLPQEEINFMKNLFVDSPSVTFDGQYDSKIKNAIDDFKVTLQFEHDQFLKKGNNSSKLWIPILTILGLYIAGIFMSQKLSNNDDLMSIGIILGFVVMVATVLFSVTYERSLFMRILFWIVSVAMLLIFGFFTLNSGKVGDHIGFFACFGFIIFGFISIVLFQYLIKQPTPEKLKTLSLIEGFKMYLGTAEEKTLQFHNPPKMTPEVFEKMLPYAMVLGVDKIWGEKFQNMLKKSSMGQENYQSSWFVGSSIMHMSFANSLNSSLSQSIASSATQPSSSGSGSGGGGFSGGGGGGGGGGGW